MAASFAVSVPEGVHGDIVPGAYKEIIILVTGASSYATGGDAFGLTQLNALVPASLIYQIIVANPYTNGTNATVTAYNASTGKLQSFGGTPAGGVIPETAAATNLSTYTATLLVRYR